MGWIRQAYDTFTRTEDPIASPWEVSSLDTGGLKLDGADMWGKTNNFNLGFLTGEGDYGDEQAAAIKIISIGDHTSLVGVRARDKDNGYFIKTGDGGSGAGYIYKLVAGVKTVFLASAFYPGSGKAYYGIRASFELLHVYASATIDFTAVDPSQWGTPVKTFSDTTFSRGGKPLFCGVVNQSYAGPRQFAAWNLTGGITPAFSGSGTGSTGIGGTGIGGTGIGA